MQQAVADAKDNVRAGAERPPEFCAATRQSLEKLNRRSAASKQLAEEEEPDDGTEDRGSVGSPTPPNRPHRSSVTIGADGLEQDEEEPQQVWLRNSPNTFQAKNMCIQHPLSSC